MRCFGCSGRYQNGIYNYAMNATNDINMKHILKIS